MPPSTAATRSRPRAPGPLARAVEAELAPDPRRSLRFAAWRVLRNAAESGDEDRLAELADDYPRLLALRIDPGPPRTLVPGSDARKKAGSVYTPPWLVHHLLDRAAQPMIEASRATGDPRAVLALRFCDPACGSGAFLLPLLERLVQALASLDPGAPPADLLQCLCGCDLDPVAARACRARLCARAGVPWRSGSLRDRIVVGESLTEVDWPTCFPEICARGGFDAIVGNPPFLGQLSAGTALPRETARRLRERFEGAVRGYADIASAFLLASTEMTRDGGRVGIVQPLSVLASRDASAVRARVLARGSIESAWIGEGGEFDAGVNACALVVSVGHRAMGEGHQVEAAVTVGRGLAAHRVRPVGLEKTWAGIAAPVWGLPECPFRPGGSVADRAAATADFRDAYYGLQGRVQEAGEDHAHASRLITSGLIGPLALRWGAGTRIHKQAWTRPVARVDAFEGWLARWASARLVPKVLVATQGRAMEAVADARGEWLPVTPVISVMPHEPDDVWRLLAAIASPVASVEAYRRWGGTGMSVQALKVSAKQVLELPLPIDGAAWDRGAQLARQIQTGSLGTGHAIAAHRTDGAPSASERAVRASGPDVVADGGPPGPPEFGALHRFGATMLDAYAVGGLDREAVLSWWLGRLGVA